MEESISTSLHQYLIIAQLKKVEHKYFNFVKYNTPVHTRKST